jgi:NADPH:quinone reductase-like Zn-dependent oxidoreductase
MTLPETMTAARVHRFGGPDMIELEQIAVPRPGQGEILVKVEAAGVGPWDAWIRAGKSALPQPLPLTLGSDLAGIVAAVGPGAGGFLLGDTVLGVTNTRFVGAYAEYAVAAAGMVAKRPPGLDAVDAASVPVIAVTAWQALFDEAGLTKGQTVLIHGAAGNVGAYAVQLAKRAGIRVVATAGAADLDAVRRLGADTVVDYRDGRFEEAGAVDAVIDLVGGEAQTRSFAVLRQGGALVSAVSPPAADLAARHGVRAKFFLVGVTTERLQEIVRLLAGGDLATNVGGVIPLAEARRAHEMLDGARPRPRGKLVLRVAP